MMITRPLSTVSQLKRPSTLFTQDEVVILPPLPKRQHA